MDQIRYRVYAARAEGKTSPIVYGYHENVELALVSVWTY